jgi:hypothetical protein
MWRFSKFTAKDNARPVYGEGECVNCSLFFPNTLNTLHCHLGNDFELGLSASRLLLFFIKLRIATCFVT